VEIFADKVELSDSDFVAQLKGVI